MAFKNTCLMFLLTLLQAMCSEQNTVHTIEASIVDNDEHYGPVIGVSAQLIDNDDPSSGSYIAASYVKYLESAGARVVPVPASWTADQVRKLFPHLSGYLFPGGSAHMLTSGYYHHAQVIFELATQHRDTYNEYFPVWGTCLGFETLHVLVAKGDANALTDADAIDISLPLDFKEEVLTSHLFADASRQLLNDLSKLPMTYNYHQKCVSVETYQNNTHLSSFFTVLSTNKDRQGKEFVSTVEAKNYPIYATQWHPEKNAYEWNANLKIDHSPQSVKAAQFMTNMFVNECRKSTHRFPQTELENYIIYNYTPEFCGKQGKSHFMQRYVFK